MILPLKPGLNSRFHMTDPATHPNMPNKHMTIVKPEKGLLHGMRSLQEEGKCAVQSIFRA
jgi:hypothetical protein